MKLINMKMDETIKINKWPKQIPNCILLEFDGSMQGYSNGKVKNTWAIVIDKKGDDVTIYHANAIKSFTAVEFSTLPIQLIKEIAKLT